MRGIRAKAVRRTLAVVLPRGYTRNQYRRAKRAAMESPSRTNVRGVVVYAGRDLNRRLREATKLRRIDTEARKVARLATRRVTA